MDVQENNVQKVKVEKTSEQIITETSKWYKLWLNLPKIAFISIVSLFFIWGIIDPLVFKYSTGGGSWYSEKTYYYGIMMINDGVACWFIWQCIGWALGGITYVIAKLKISPIILQTEYLKKISEKE